MTITRQLILLGMLHFVGLGCGPSDAHAAEQQSVKRHFVGTQSEIFSMDKVHKSMFGPSDRDLVTLRTSDEPEILWVTAITANVVGPDGESPESSEYFCHSALARIRTQRPARAKLLGRWVGHTRKMFTLVQGHTEIRFPDGFGMPVLSNDEFASSVMVMNPLEREATIRVGVDSRIEYVREADARGSIRPLFLVPFVVRVPLQDGSSPHASHAESDAESCLSHDSDDNFAVSVDRGQIKRPGNLTTGASGEQLTAHWVVPPGRHVYRHKIEGLNKAMKLDSRAHYISAHLHPFGTSLELTDLTTGKSVFKSEAENFPDRIAVEQISSYSSQEGIPIFRNHEYEIVAVYDNTSDVDVDSMAILYVYMLDANPPKPIALGEL
jgi:hypothetical protein